ncbi:MAG: flavodoxin family protein [Clostridia bacterium]|nr:flavodoxin family protein [Clostridia bacterium]
MSKCIVLFASANKNGFTKQLTDCFLSEYNGTVNFYNMYEENFAPCTGCGYCTKHGKCHIDDMNDILKDIFSSDFVIFASPVYNYTFPAPMKAFSDRLQLLFDKEKTACDRKGFLLASCGKSGKFSVDVMQKQCDIAFCELSCKNCGNFFFINTDKRSALQQDEIRKVKELAKEFFNKAF